MGNEVGDAVGVRVGASAVGVGVAVGVAVAVAGVVVWLAPGVAVAVTTVVASGVGVAAGGTRTVGCEVALEGGGANGGPSTFWAAGIGVGVVPVEGPMATTVTSEAGLGSAAATASPAREGNWLTDAGAVSLGRTVERGVGLDVALRIEVSDEGLLATRLTSGERARTT